MIYLVTGQQEMFSPVGYSFATVEQSLEYLKKLDIIGFDTETRGMDPYTCDLLSMQLGDADNQFVVDCLTVSPSLYKDLLESKVLIMHNAKFDLRFLYHQRITPIKVFDTFLAEKILTNGYDSIGRSLDVVVYRYCKKELDKSIRGNIHKEGLSTRVIKYAADDVVYLHQIMRKQQAKLEENKLHRAMDLDNKFVLVLAYVEYCGMYLNYPEWEKKCIEDLADLEVVKENLDKFILDNPDKYPEFINNQLSLFDEGISCKLNWASSKQVIPFMQSLGVDTLVKDKMTGLMKNSVDKKVLGPQKKKNPIIPVYIDYTEHQKLVSTYGLNWKSYLNKATGRIHTNYNQLLNTGRMSSGQKGNPKRGIQQLPNMQNVPSDARTRSCFQAEEGNVLIVSDYSGQETIILANKCLDPKLLEFYNSGESDMHSFVCKQIAIASNIFPKEIANLDLNTIKDNYKKERQTSKSVGFSINYGGTGQTIAQNAQVTAEEGEEIYKAYFKAFPGLANYFKTEKQRALELGYIQFNNLTGRKYFIPYFDDYVSLHKEIYETPGFWDDYKREKLRNSDDFRHYYKPKVREYFMKKGDIERMSLNFPIQGSSSDVTKLAGIYFFEYLVKNNLLFKVLICNIIHDEFVSEAPEELGATIAEELQKAMERAGDVFCKTVKLKAQPVITSKWEH